LEPAALLLPCDLPFIGWRFCQSHSLKYFQFQLHFPHPSQPAGSGFRIARLHTGQNILLLILANRAKCRKQAYYRPQMPALSR
jgi:hypothetical protein